MPTLTEMTTILLIVLLALASGGWYLTRQEVRFLLSWNQQLRGSVRQLDHSAKLSRGDARHARLLMMAVCLQEGGEYRINKRTLVEIGPMDVLMREQDMETGDEVFGVLKQEVKEAEWFGKEKEHGDADAD